MTKIMITLRRRKDAAASDDDHNNDDDDDDDDISFQLCGVGRDVTRRRSASKTSLKKQIER